MAVTVSFNNISYFRPARTDRISLLEVQTQNIKFAPGVGLPQYWSDVFHYAKYWKMKFPMRLANRHTVRDRQTLEEKLHVSFYLSSRWWCWSLGILPRSNHPGYHVLRWNVFIKSDKRYMIEKCRSIYDDKPFKKPSFNSIFCQERKSFKFEMN
jgi:hypothetical protein